MSGLDIVLIGIVLVINLISAYFLFKDPVIKEEIEEKSENQMLMKKKIFFYASFFIILNLAVSILFCVQYKENSFLFSLKRLCLLGLLWPIGYIDFKTYRIPNRFILLGVGYRVIILILELIFEGNTLPAVLVSEGVAALGLLIAALLCTICIKNSIGYGDIKLFCVMGLMLGLEGIWNSVFMSLIAAFIISVILLITKKKSRKDAVPFAPAIVLGTYISIILTGM